MKPKLLMNSTICRICLEPDIYKDIHEQECGEKGKRKNCAEILMFCCDVKADNQISTKLCKKCYYKLGCFYKFKMLAINSDNHLRSIATKGTDEDEIFLLINGDQEQIKFEIKEEHDIESGVEYLEEGDWDLNDAELSPTESFKDQFVDTENKIQPEDDDQPSAINTKQLRKKSTKGNKLVSVKKKKKRYGEVLGPQVCHECGKVVNCMSLHAQTHLPIEQRHQYPCKSCPKVYDNETSLKSHVRNIHLHPRKKGFCDICNKEYSCIWSHNIMIHKTKEARFSCVVCQKRFLSKLALENHLRIRHTKETPFECDQCELKYAVKAFLVRHIRTVHMKIKPFICHLCSKSFARKHQMERHMATHTDAKLHKCEQCDKSFKTAEGFREHQYLHTGKKHFECPVCGKRFFKKSILYAHSWSHKEARFGCRHCEKVYRRAIDRDKHESKHHPGRETSFNDKKL